MQFQNCQLPTWAKYGGRMQQECNTTRGGTWECQAAVCTNRLKKIILCWISRLQEPNGSSPICTARSCTLNDETNWWHWKLCWARTWGKKSANVLYSCLRCQCVAGWQPMDERNTKGPWRWRPDTLHATCPIASSASRPPHWPLMQDNTNENKLQFQHVLVATDSLGWWWVAMLLRSSTLWSATCVQNSPALGTAPNLNGAASFVHGLLAPCRNYLQVHGKLWAQINLFCKLGIPCGCACCSTSARQVTRSFTCTVKLMCPCYTVSSSIPNTWTGPNQLVHTVPVVPHKAVAEASKIGEIGCCESGMAERIHWWTERCLRSPLFLSLSLTIYLPTYLPTYLSSTYVSIYRSIDRSIYLSIYVSMYLCIIMYLCMYLSISLSLSLSSVYLSICLAVYLSIYLSIDRSIYLSACLSVVQRHSV